MTTVRIDLVGYYLLFDGTLPLTYKPLYLILYMDAAEHFQQRWRCITVFMILFSNPLEALTIVEKVGGSLVCTVK